MPIWQWCNWTVFCGPYVVYLTRANRFRRPFSRPSTSMKKGVWMTEYYLTAAIIVILALAVMFIISKVQE
jgi:hypothetical protein